MQGKRKKLLWQIYPWYIATIFAALVAMTLFASSQMRYLYLREVAGDLEARARLIADWLRPDLMAGDVVHIDSLSKAWGEKTGTRITIVGPYGEVLGDSDESPAVMENHGTRPEILESFERTTNIGTATRFSTTVEREMMYVALELERDDGSPLAVVRTSLPVTRIDAALTNLNLRIALGGLVVVVLATLISLFTFGRISRPLGRLKEGADRFARGEFEPKLQLPDTEEIAALAESMNRMAAQLDERISQIVRQRNEQDAVLSSMIEGVLAVDSEYNIINLNQAASQLFGVEPYQVRGSKVHDVIWNIDLQKFVEKTVNSESPVEGEIVLQDDEMRYLQAHGTLLRSASQRAIGAVIVLNDVTRIRKLESIRRDFVANVSHELKTPITSIRGFVETLLDGAVSEPEDTRRFLKIIIKHASRLNAIVEDLLTLSRIETETEQGAIDLIRGRLLPVLTAAVQTVEGHRADKAINIEISCDPDIYVHMHSRQLEQAVTNLIDNGIKYSGAESTIRVSADRIDDEIVVSVSDQGIGIERSHLPRLFERFYRVDKGRSREVGGTGLGLAIVKHIAIAHGGRISVTSSPGQGSTFRIHIPAGVQELAAGKSVSS